MVSSRRHQCNYLALIDLSSVCGTVFRQTKDGLHLREVHRLSWTGTPPKLRHTAHDDTVHYDFAGRYLPYDWANRYLSQDTVSMFRRLRIVDKGEKDRLMIKSKNSVEYMSVSATGDSTYRLAYPIPFY